ncbi:MAG: hypothetical protein CMJ81_11690 [Planctomycetaceae bacterium]|nr:hypothetical protein [Planctomycetaceae bacterium]MBP63985.1 hypothetical protein [Planctomycetaceae bacterium]
MELADPGTRLDRNLIHSASRGNEHTMNGQNQPLFIGTRRQLFVDDVIIQQLNGASRTLHQPARYAGNPLMFPLYPWEGRMELYGTVCHDTETGQFRMWYTGLGEMGISPMGVKNETRWAHLGFDPERLLYSICYATSGDGIFWERPNLGIVDYRGSTDNNVVVFNASAANVIRDDRDPDPNRLYKSLFYESLDPDGTSNEGDGVSIAFSPDGLHWTKHAGNPVISKVSDSHTLLGWDELHDQYVAYCRPSVHGGNTTRRIGRSVSDDFIHWSDPQEVLVPDEQDPPGLQFYNMPVFKYEGLYLGQLLAYHTYPEEPHVRIFGNIDVQLAVSRDGISWERVADREPFMPNGPPGSMDAGEIYVANAPVMVDDELWFYYSPCPVEHGPTGRSGPICLAKLRLDGFVSVDAGESPATLVTRPFVCAGDSLKINAAARGGLISVAVIDEQEMQYDGFAKSDSAIFDGDSVRHEMSWRKASLAGLKGKVIRLKFYLRNCQLFSFTIQ